MNEIQSKILNIMNNGSIKGKQKISPIDLRRKLDLSQKKVKCEVRSLIEQQKLAYWSSGSRDYLMLKKDYDSLKRIEESN